MGNCYSMKRSKASNGDGPRLNFDAFDAQFKVTGDPPIHAIMRLCLTEQRCIADLIVGDIIARDVDSPGVTSLVSVSLKYD